MSERDPQDRARSAAAQMDGRGIVRDHRLEPLAAAPPRSEDRGCRMSLPSDEQQQRAKWDLLLLDIEHRTEQLRQLKT